jgi:hypothetical protein
MIWKIWKESRLNSEKIKKYGRKINWIVIRYGKYGGNASWILKRDGNYGRKVSRIENRYEPCWRKASWNVK